jgi:tetratricopeptide (TPR) repeat protein
MFNLKSLSKTSIEAALEKAVRYRLLNEPDDAESICRDVLAIDSDHQPALVNLLLALTDQFVVSIANRYQESQEIAARLLSEYEREYYAGIIAERRGKAIQHRAAPGWGCVAFDWFRRAMECYERSEKLQPDNNDDATLRWNSCARIIMSHSEIKPDEIQTSSIQSE